MMEANNISFVVDEITAYSRTRSGVQAANGYVFVVVKMRIVNNNRIVSLYGDDIILVDGHNNQYTQQFTVGFDLPEIQWVEPGQSVSGALVYNLPTPALNNSLKIRFEPDFYQTRFEVNFDPLVIQP